MRSPLSRQTRRLADPPLRASSVGARAPGNRPSRRSADNWHQLATRAQAKRDDAPVKDPAEREADQVSARLVGKDPNALRDSGSRGLAPGLPVVTEVPPSPIEGDRDRDGLVDGRALDADSRSFFEPRLGTDLSQVRIHTDDRAQSAARGLGARAFTVGRDVAFGAGEYRPGTPDGRRLLAHELVHVLQQDRHGLAVQRQDAAGDATPAAAPAAPPPGTLADVVAFVTTPADEPDATLQAAMGLWSRYSSRVRVTDVVFRLLPAAEQESAFGSGHRIGGRSHWDGATPVIELPQVILDDIAGYVRVRGTPEATVGDTETPQGEEAAAAVRFQRAPLERAHEAVRLIGHELHHLWRVREGHSGNPLQAPFEEESRRRMDQVRANWVEWLRDAPAPSLRDMGIPAGTVINRWEDIPEPVRRSIEEGAAQTDFIAGLYQRSAYLVEEIYTKIEELSYLRVQQRDPTASVYYPSRSEVNQLATLIYFLNNVLHSMEDPQGLVTADRLRRTETEMLAYLRRRYPSSAGAQYDSYEVVFFLSAIRGGLPPLYSGGRLISTVPGARVPP